MRIFYKIIILVFISGVFLAAACNPNELPCVNNYIPEIPIVAVFQDTMVIGDTIDVTVIVADSLQDILTGSFLDLNPTDIDNRLEFSFERLDTNVIDIAVERFFEWEDITGEVTEWEQSNFTRLFLKFEQTTEGRVCSFRLYPHNKGTYLISFSTPTDFLADMEVQHFSECLDVLDNIYFKTNNSSISNNYHVLSSAFLEEQRNYLLEDFNRQGVFAFVVK